MYWIFMWDFIDIELEVQNKKYGHGQLIDKTIIWGSWLELDFEISLVSIVEINLLQVNNK